MSEDSEKSMYKPEFGKNGQPVIYINGEPVDLKFYREFPILWEQINTSDK